LREALAAFRLMLSPAIGRLGFEVFFCIGAAIVRISVEVSRLIVTDDH